MLEQHGLPELWRFPFDVQQYDVWLVPSSCFLGCPLASLLTSFLALPPDASYGSLVLTTHRPALPQAFRKVPA